MVDTTLLSTVIVTIFFGLPVQRACNFASAGRWSALPPLARIRYLLARSLEVLIGTVAAAFLKFISTYNHLNPLADAFHAWLGSVILAFVIGVPTWLAAYAMYARPRLRAAR